MVAHMPGKVLIADDDDDLRAVLAEYLTRRGYEVLQAANGLEALLHVKRNAPDVVVIDVAMPRLGGLEAVKHIRAFNPAIRVVVITGLSDADIHRQARALGVAVLFKPLEYPDLLDAVQGGAAPRRTTAVAPAAAAASAEVAVRPEAPRTKLLLVDDDDAFVDMLEELLASKGYPTRSVGTAAEALRVIEDTPPDVVLLDIDMPGLTGIDALPVIRAVAPRTPVIMVSGTDDVTVARRALAYGAFDYVTKPIDIVYLSRSIDAALMTGALDE